MVEDAPTGPVLRLLPPLAPNCVSADAAESDDVAHDWREVGWDAMQQYDECIRCGRVEPWTDHPYRAEAPEAGFDE